MVLKQRRFWTNLIFTALFSFLAQPFQAAAQTSTQTVQIKALVAQCSEGAMLSECPSTCKTACTDVEFLTANVERCAVAIAAGPNSDGPTCNPKDKIELTTFGECVELARAIEREPNAVIRSDQEWLDLYNAFFSDKPTCAASDEAVTEMYRCLQGETELVTLEYGSLSSFDAQEGDLDNTKLREMSCQYSEDEMMKMVIGAKGLRGRASLLDDNLGTVSTCRKQYADWLDARGGFCEEGNFPNCEQIINIFQDDLRNSLDGAEEQSKQIGDMLTSLSKDLETVFTLGVIRPSKCP